MHGMTVVDRTLAVELAATARDAAAAGPVNPFAALQMQQMHQARRMPANIPVGPVLPYAPPFSTEETERMEVVVGFSFLLCAIVAGSHVFRQRGSGRLCANCIQAASRPSVAEQAPACLPVQCASCIDRL